MGTFNKGLLGGFSGKVGPVIGSEWRGKNVLRSMPSKSEHEPSEAQLRQRQKFKYMLHFLNPIKHVLSSTFPNYGDKTPFNRATSYHLKEAIVSTGEGFELIYSKILISMGELCGLQDPLVTLSAPLTLALQWADNSDQGLAYPDDELLVIAYAPTLDRFEIATNTALRANTQCLLHLPELFEGLPIELWATFKNASGTMSATSRYLGRIDV